jgi:hypothetical protein
VGGGPRVRRLCGMCYAELIVESKRASRGVTPLAHEQPYGPHLYLRSNSPFPETRIKSVERRLADNETMVRVDGDLDPDRVER